MPGFARLALLLSFAASATFAQELSPRAYWPAPDGTRLLLAGYAFSTGDVITDPSLPVTGVDSTLHRAVLGYFHTLSLFDRTSNIVVELPYAWGTTTGTLDGEFRRRDLSNMGDLSLTLSINLSGAPTMTREEFRALSANPRPIFGASLRIIAPTGDYDPEKLINVGANRWAAKMELGYIRPLRPDWHFELELGAWLFVDNDDFLGGTREQEPIYATEMHLVRRLGGGRWVSIEANFYRGGQTTVNGEQRDDLQRNSNVGASMVWPIGARSSVRLGLSFGAVTESGGDYTSVLVNYIRVIS